MPHKLSVDSYTRTRAGIACHCSTIGNTTDKHRKVVKDITLDAAVTLNDEARNSDRLSDIINTRENRTTTAVPVLTRTMRITQFPNRA